MGEAIGVSVKQICLVQEDLGKSDAYVVNRKGMLRLTALRFLAVICVVLKGIVSRIAPT